MDSRYLDSEFEISVTEMPPRIMPVALVREILITWDYSRLQNWLRPFSPKRLRAQTTPSIFGTGAVLSLSSCLLRSASATDVAESAAALFVWPRGQMTLGPGNSQPNGICTQA
jgi:hypothetical protein